MNINLVAANTSKWIAWGPVRITQLHGYNNQGTSVYIQLHQVPPKADGTLAAGTVPAVKSLECLPGLPFAFTLDFTLSECFLALSTTELTYTAVGAGGGLDLTVVASGEFLCDGTEAVVGDLTTAVNTLQVWTEAAGPKRLLRLDVIELLAVARFVVIQATDADANVPTDQILPIAASATVSGSMGSDGLLIFTKSAAQVLSQGCTIRVVNGVTFPWAQTAVCANIRAIYK